MKTTHTYQLDSTSPAGISCAGPARLVTLKGRTGLQAQSIHTRFRLGQHTLNTEKGAVTMWVLPTESLASTAMISHIAHHDPAWESYVLLSDQENLRDWGAAKFAWVWSSGWYPQWWAKFFVGGIYPDAYNPVARAAVTAGHFHFHAWEWYQIALTWDKPANQFRLYANGILIATSNQFAKSLEHVPCDQTLYFGEPVFAYGDMAFYDTCPDAEQVAKIHTEEAVTRNPELELALRKTFAGEAPDLLDWTPDAAWTKRMDLPLNAPDTMEHFYVQGYEGAPRVVEDGLLVETRMQSPAPGEEDNHQVYLWTKETFEGDFALEFEFKPELPNGLSLLMLQANGMHGEDFMADYPLRTTGSMKMVFGEAVRNYHWEFFRGMDDTRNDVASSALIKQPWQQPLAYHCGTAPLAMHSWHKVQFVQEGKRLRGAINGEVVFDVADEGIAAFTGSHYTHGHLAIRCMVKTRNTYRNLRIWNRSLQPGLALGKTTIS